MLSPALILLSLFSGVALCKLYDNVADLPGLKYDFVIVGGGTAGNVVANRLTENPKIAVLVLEAGLSNEGVTSSQVPFLLNQLIPDSTYSWNYTTVPMPGLNGRSMPYFRAFFLGGCSAHNGMVYTRGAADDFNRYATLTGDKGWSWDRILPYFLKSEKWSPPADHHDTRGQFNPKVHGTKGPISVSLNGFPWSTFEQKVIQTTKELPHEFPFNLDMNSGQPLGVSWLQSTIGGGERSTSATGYLAPKFIRRPNLHVLLHAQVSKLVNATHKAGKPAFGGVQFRYGNSLFVAHASKEIILSAGPVGSPQILLNSGIGAHSTLSALGIPPVLDLPSVGKNASDHPSLFIMQWEVNSNETFASITGNATRFAQGLAQWNTSRTGPFVDSGVGTHIGFSRLPKHSSAFAVHADPSPGPGAPHLEMTFTPGGFGAVGANLMTIDIAVVSPVSRGSVTINSNDPFAPPLIDPGYLSSEFDVIALREGVAQAKQFVSAPVWSGYLGAMTTDIAGLSDLELETLIRSSTGSSFHLVGTAGMSARGARYGVVDPDLQVKGISGLSVIDASVVPIVPAAHTAAVTYAFAERGADLLKQRWSC
ncbi:pyranose dehydrogenase [Mycena albidolilacea]|uniref:Pyranose dehydrogenase n=1 Tax=Mycena albidolilacea TaxID=1033008 RepID=A0AAD7AVT5_9AGAR|nr:pyranose dehydrogenase [Mycena albidolilacea]